VWIAFGFDMQWLERGRQGDDPTLDAGPYAGMR